MVLFTNIRYYTRNYTFYEVKNNLGEAFSSMLFVMLNFVRSVKTRCAS